MKRKSLLFALLFIGVSSTLIAQEGYEITAERGIKSKQNELLGNEISMKVNNPPDKWSDQAFVTISQVKVSDMGAFKLMYTSRSKQKEVNGEPDTVNKTLTFNLRQVVEMAKAGLFVLKYKDEEKGAFQFAVEPDKDAAKDPKDEKQSRLTDYDIKKDTKLMIDAYKFVPDLLNAGYEKDSRFNVYRQGNKIIIYVDAAGHLLKTPMPTTGIRGFTYEVHLIKREQDQTYDYQVSRPDGGLTDEYNIYYPQTLKSGNATPSGATVQPDPNNNLQEIIFSPIGPYEQDFKLSLIRTNLNNDKELPVDILGQKIKVAKFYYVSIQGGLFATTLRNPKNIKPAVMPDGDTTLTADDPSTRGIFTIMAVYYPSGRSFLFPPKGGIFSPERFGIVIGTRLDKDQFENFLGGVQFDFARGGSVSLGAHYGRRDFVEGRRDFNFGRDKFTGTLENNVRKGWDLGFFIGATVDVRILNFLFASQNL
jgi:hypothetical protein